MTFTLRDAMFCSSTINITWKTTEILKLTRKWMEAIKPIPGATVLLFLILVCHFNVMYIALSASAEHRLASAQLYYYVDDTLI